MKIQITVLFLSLFLCAAVADPRGARGIRGKPVKRKLQDDGPVVTEFHACEPDAQAAITYVSSFGYPDQGDMDCFEDPVNACPGGCCRYANWFVCDEDNEQPHMPCVCNANTAPVLDVSPPLSGSTPDGTGATIPPMGATSPLGNVTITNATVASIAAAPTPTPLTPEEFAEQYPEILAAIEAQENAPPPLNSDPVVIESAMGDDPDDDEESESESKDDKKGKDKTRDLFD